MNIAITVALLLAILIAERDRVVPIVRRLSGFVPTGGAGKTSRQDAVAAVETLIAFAEAEGLDAMAECARNAGREMWGKGGGHSHPEGE